MTNSFLELGFPTPDELIGLPQRDIVVLTLRCAQRVRPLIDIYLVDMPSNMMQKINRTLTLAEEMAFAREWEQAFEAGRQYANDCVAPDAPPIVDNVFKAVHSAAVSAWRAINWKDEVHILFISEQARVEAWRRRIIYATLQTFHFAAEAIRSGPDKSDRLNTLRDAVIQDYSMLCKAAKSREWSDFSPMPEDFFALRTSFDQEATSFKHIIEISLEVSRELIARLSREPKGLVQIPPYVFEKVIAELFRGFGFDVELTSQTRDGGYDIIAIGETLVHRTKYLIECKRYAMNQKINVVPVRALYGVVQDQGATKGILVSTGGFTSPAQKFIDKHKWNIEGRGFDDIVKWLRLYDELRIRNSVLTLGAAGHGKLPTS